MKDFICQDFQKNVEQYLIRHQSILDILSKAQETNARVNRAVTKAVTQCGCLQIDGKKNVLPEDASLSDMKSFFSNQLTGQLCEHCREIVEQEMGKNLFYLTALCTVLDLHLEDILAKENSKVLTLRMFNLT